MTKDDAGSVLSVEEAEEMLTAVDRTTLAVDVARTGPASEPIMSLHARQSQCKLTNIPPSSPNFVPAFKTPK